ncbi:MAG TPA: amidohydrolase family protein [Longimicrobiales bacterium]|nr:amidohydrolase family protein [Longimicrobiales bacterium]
MIRAAGTAATAFALALPGCAAPPRLADPAVVVDVILRGGTVVDGTGGGRYVADVGVRGGHIVALGDLSAARAALELNVAGLIVAPGFINLHSHAAANALPTAVNMLTQGVTMELLNSDGGGPLDIAQQLASRDSAGLAVNIGAYAPFNSAWSSVVGTADRRPGAEEIESMRELIRANLERGAWGVSAGLDYKPAYFARVEEVVQVLEPARRWRTNFTNHDRVTPESGYSSRAGMLETMQIGEAAGLVPVITHMKLQGVEQGTAGAFLQTMSDATSRGVYTAADAYPYLAGQTGLVALIIPGWAQEGGRAEMLKRFDDPAQRARIVVEAEEAMRARFGGAEGIYLATSRTQLVDVMRELQLTSAGEAVIRVLEAGNQTAILRFGSERDLVQILQHPTTSIACDCGAVLTATHPRGFGTYPRVLGRYVREQKLLTWEDAIRKMSGLPASTIGMIDRGFLVPGMAADIVVFDSSTVIDRATYDDPTALSDGIRHVLVNGRLALHDGRPTGARGGRAQRRASTMPSRPMSTHLDRRVWATGSMVVLRHDGRDSTVVVDVALDVFQQPGARRARGMMRISDANNGTVLAAGDPGIVQTTARWASVTGVARFGSTGEDRAYTVVIEEADSFVSDQPPTVTVEIDGLPRIRGRLQRGQVRIEQGG